MKTLAVGLMSGTSLDGIDVVIASIEGVSTETKITMLHGKTIPYSKALLKKIQMVLTQRFCTAEGISSVHFELAIAYSDAVKEVCQEYGVKLSDIGFIASHGQTIFHINESTNAFHQSSLQLGDGSVIANLCETTVVSNFRNADIAQGGCGAPLVPYADYILFHHPSKNIVLQNIGGIANVTVVPQSGNIDDVFAFDSGPGNMMIDEAMKLLFYKPYDDGGEIARSGVVHQPLLDHLMKSPFLKKEPPKSTGREQFGSGFTSNLLTEYSRVDKRDIISTFTHFTALSISEAYQKWILPKMDIDQIVVSGGGAKNTYLLELLRLALPGIEILTSDQVGMSSDFKEALAFIILGNETLHHRPSSVVGATGAKQSTILGQVSYFK